MFSVCVWDFIILNSRNIYLSVACKISSWMKFEVIDRVNTGVTVDRFRTHWALLTRKGQRSSFLGSENGDATGTAIHWRNFGFLRFSIFGWFLAGENWGGGDGIEGIRLIDFCDRHFVGWFFLDFVAREIISSDQIGIFFDYKKVLLTLEDFAKTAVALRRRPGRTVIEATVAIEDAPWDRCRTARRGWDSTS